MTTPSQLAKEFAAQHGFTITPNGRRYTVTKGQIQFEVGGYETALNHMNRFVAMQAEDEQTAIFNNPNDPHLQVAEQKGMRGCAECTDEPECAWHQQCLRENVALTPADHADMLNDPERPTGVTPVEWTAHRAAAALDVASGPDQTVVTWADRRTQEQKAAADEFNKRSFAKIEEYELAQARARGVPGGPWHVNLNGYAVMRYGYPTRQAALDVVRWGFNHQNSHIRSNWRTMAVFIEYRPS